MNHDTTRQVKRREKTAEEEMRKRLEKAERLRAAEERSRKYMLRAPGRARVIHPEYGEVIVPCRSKFTAILCAAKAWGCDWTEISHAAVLATDYRKEDRKAGFKIWPAFLPIMTDLAIQKLKKEYQTTKGDKYGSVVKKPLLDVLCEFCRQDAEFAQAVYQGGNFEDALAAAVKGAQNHTPDIQIYRQAVQFYFPGSDIQLTMKINLCASVEKEEPAGPATPEADRSSISLDLTDFL